MSKLIEQNPLKKSRFLKYSLLASISSVGAIMTVPFEGIASSEHINLNVIERGDNGLLPPVINNKFERVKSFGTADNKRKRPPTRRKTLVGNETTEQNQNTYNPEPTEQPTVSSTSSSFVTAPNTPSTTPIFLTPSTSPEHIYTTAPGTQYEPTTHATPNNQHAVAGHKQFNPAAVQRRLSFSEPQQIGQAITTIKPVLPPKPTTLETTAGIINHISKYNENAKSKLSTIITAIETSDKKVKQAAQKIKSRIASDQKKIQKVESQAKNIEKEIRILVKANTSLQDGNNGIKSDNERAKHKTQITKNIEKIKQFEKKLTDKKNEADKLSQEIDSLVNELVLTKPQEKAPVTETTIAGPFLNQQRKLDVFNQQQRVNAVRKAVVDKKKAQAEQVKRNSADTKKLIAQIKQAQLEQNQQHIAEERKRKLDKRETIKIENKSKADKVRKEKTLLQKIKLTKTEEEKKTANDKKVRTIAEKTRKERNKQAEKAEEIRNIKLTVSEQLTQMLDYKKKVQEAEKIEAKNKVSAKIKKELKNIEKLVSKAEKTVSDLETETSRTALRAMQDKMNDYSKQLYKIEDKIKLLTPVVYNSKDSIYKQPPKAKPDMLLTSRIQGTLGKQLDEKDGYLVPNQAHSQIYTTVLPDQTVVDLKSMDLGFVSLGKETDTDVGFNPSWGEGTYLQVGKEPSSEVAALKALGYQDNINQQLDTIARADSIEHPILFQNLLKDLERKKQEAQLVAEQAIVHVTHNPNDNKAKEQAALVSKLLEKYNTDIKLVKKALEDNKENNRRNNNIQKPLEHLDPVLEAKLVPLREYDAVPEESQKLIASKRDTEGQYFVLEDNPKPEKLTIEHMAPQKKQSQLEQDIEAIDSLFQSAIYSDTGCSELSRSSSVDNINSVSSGIDSNDSTTSIRNKIAVLQAYQIAVTVKRQELEQLPSTSSGVDQTSQQIKELKEEELTMHDIINACIADPSKLNNVSLEEINDALKKVSAGSSRSVINILESKDLEDPDSTLDATSQKMLSSNNDDTTINSLQSEEKQSSEDEESIDTGIQKAEDKGLPATLPISSNEYKLILSDDSEDEDNDYDSGIGSESEDNDYDSGIASESEDNDHDSGIGSESEDNDYDSGIASESEDNDHDSGIGSESEDELVDQLPDDSREDNLTTTEFDTVTSLKQEVIEEAKKSIAAIAPTLNQGVQVVKNISKSILSARLDSSEALNAVASGDEEDFRIKRGLWIRGMYGTNNHGRVDNMTGYRGINKAATIGFDIEIDNNIVGIAYSNVYSVFKFKNSKNNDKEFIKSHVVSIYGQKELPKNFLVQALVSASKNFIKDKTTYSYGGIKIRSNVKHRNHSYNAEALLNYNYLVKNNLIITPNIGLRYGKSRDGVYNETGINVQEIALTMKENNILSGIVGTKVKVPLKDALKFHNLGLIFQGAVEHNFKEKTQRINRVVKIFDNTFKQNYLIPKQAKTSYNLGAGVMGIIKNTTISLDYNYYLNKHYRSHQGSIKLKVNL
ncbi:autotransporter domain-containing protein [Rickettsia oklahomensis]|uniref:Autotransporter domain-containing protein n=1 Tax=Rickettsia oklahomensis TaxID=3141789 RepID=A0AAU7BZR3_9RICK